MSMVLNTNVASLTAQRHLSNSRAEMEQAMERLSSGKRINSAMDDAAGLTIAHSLDSKIASLTQATRNANDGIAMINLAEGALDEVSEMLSRMRSLAVQAANGTYIAGDRTNLDTEFDQLATEITRISDNTTFNEVSVIGGSNTLVVQIGHSATDYLQVTTADMSAATMGTTASVTSLSTAGVDTVTNALLALGSIDGAISTVDTYRAKLGAYANRLEHSAANLLSRIEHQSSARSRIQDADYAVESAALAKAQVLQQAGTAMLAQANASTANVLSLLK